jgi:hypothetical protein
MNNIEREAIILKSAHGPGDLAHRQFQRQAGIERCRHISEKCKRRPQIWASGL